MIRDNFIFNRIKLLKTDKFESSFDFSILVIGSLDFLTWLQEIKVFVDSFKLRKFSNKLFKRKFLR